MPSEIALSSTEVPKPERLGEGKRKRGRLGSWSLPMLAPLCPVFSLPSLSKSGQWKSCQVSGRFLELPPLSWKSRPAGEARRIPINISVGWTALPADAKTQRALEGFGQHSQTLGTPRWQAGLPLVNPPTKEEVIRMSQLNSWIPFLTVCLGSTLWILIMVFQNNTILAGKALDDTTLDEREWSHILP